MTSSRVALRLFATDLQALENYEPQEREGYTIKVVGLDDIGKIDIIVDVDENWEDEDEAWQSCFDVASAIHGDLVDLGIGRITPPDEDDVITL